MKKSALTFLTVLTGAMCLFAENDQNPLSYDYYIMGDQMVTGRDAGTLSNIKYKGFSSDIAPGSMISGVRTEDEKFLYRFQNIRTLPEINLENAVLQYWRQDEDGVWMTDSESGNGIANRRMDYDACFILVLDNSKSLGEGAHSVRQGAKEFIEEMYRTSNPEVGNIRIGIICFSTMDDTQVFPITRLTYANKTQMLNFINSQTTSRKATSMYYAINKGVDMLTEYADQNEFNSYEGTHILTFTDGLDNTSQLESEGLYSINDVASFVENKMRTTSIHGAEIDKWVIGVQGVDVPDQQLSRMKSKLSALSSQSNQFIWVDNFSNLAGMFARIAKSLTARWTNLYCTSALNHNGAVCWTYGVPKKYVAPKPKTESWNHSGWFFETGVGVMTGDVDTDFGWELGTGYRWHIAGGFSWEVFRIGFNTGVSYFTELIDLRFTTGFRYDTPRLDFLKGRALYANFVLGYGYVPYYELGGFVYEIGVGAKLTRNISLGLNWQGNAMEWDFDWDESSKWGIFGVKLEYLF